MLNKKAIAAFAAGATLVSGLVFAAPAMAEKPNANPPANPPAVQSDQVTKLGGVVSNFKVGDKDHKTTAITLYKKGDKYGTAENDINYTVAQIGGGLLAQVQNSLTSADGNSIVDKVEFPSVLNSGKNLSLIHI